MPLIELGWVVSRNLGQRQIRTTQGMITRRALEIVGVAGRRR